LLFPPPQEQKNSRIRRVPLTGKTLTEFELIAKFFTRASPSALIGNGDDCAVIRPRPGNAFAVTTDTLVEGRHFLPTIDPYKLGRRVVAVNFSDLAAMGAQPRYAMLSLTLPRIDEAWVARFADGLWSALNEHNAELIGGNTTRGPLSIAMTAFGDVAATTEGGTWAITRNGAQVGDQLWVSGELGDAGWALHCMLGDVKAEATHAQIARYECPEARVALGVQLVEIASSCIDVSDGLISEATHIARASHVDIDIDFAAIPTGLGDALSSVEHAAFARHCLLATGDAYELLFTAKPDHHARIVEILKSLHLPGHCIGRVIAATNGIGGNVRVLDAKSHPMKIETRGWDHFAKDAM
jgi:thiamine-monophosphate kinase